MSWATGANVFVAIAEEDELAAGVVVHENKSGSVRVQLNDGKKITVGPEEIFENPNKTPKARPRSRSPARKSAGVQKSGGRGRSPARNKSPARTASAARKPRSASKGKKTATPKTKDEKPEKAASAKKTAEKKKEEPISSPSMTLRVRRWNKDEAIDSDTDDTKPRKKSKDDGPAKVTTEFGGAIGLCISIVLIVTVTFGGLLLLKSGTFNLRGQDWRKLVAQWPKWDWQACGLLAGFWLLQVLLSLLPVGPVENALPGATGPRQYRRNGLLAAIVTLAAVLGLRRYGYALNKAQLWAYLPVWGASSLGAAILLACFCAWKASRVPISQQNAAVVATGRFYSFVMGKQVNPTIGNVHLKMLVIKGSFTASLVLLLLTYLNFEPNGYTANAALAIPALYIADYLIFEHQLLTTFELQTEGFGAMSLIGLGIYPLMVVFTPLYVLTANVEIRNWCVICTCLLFVLGLLINRLSNNQKYRFRKNPMDPAVSHLETLPTARGKKLLVSGWWGLVRHPNYLGDIICQISMGLSAGFGHFFPWALPALSILCLLHRVSRDNHRCQAKYGDAWSRYCDKVKHRVIPKIY